MPETPTMVNTEETDDLLSVALVNLQAPMLVVTQFALPPGEKLPLTLAPATTEPVLRSRIVTVALAFQLAPLLAALPTMDFTATNWASGSVGAPAASEYTNLLGEPAPADVTRLSVAWVLKKAATAAGVAVVLAARANAATPLTCGDAIDVPLMVLMAVAPVYHAEVMLLPGPKMSTQVPKLE